jgi:Na+-driven multidrug efflux pump
MQLAEILVTIHAGCAILLWALSFVLPNALRAANDVRFTMIVSICSMVIWRLGFSYIIGVRMGYGAIGVWIAMVVDWICRVTCFVWRFESGRWESKYHA